MCWDRNVCYHSAAISCKIVLLVRKAWNLDSRCNRHISFKTEIDLSDYGVMNQNGGHFQNGFQNIKLCTMFWCTNSVYLIGNHLNLAYFITLVLTKKGYYKIKLIWLLWQPSLKWLIIILINVLTTINMTVKLWKIENQVFNGCLTHKWKYLNDCGQTKKKWRQISKWLSKY